MSTKQAAKLVGVHWMTLYRWLDQGRVRPSIGIKLNGRIIRRWTAADVERVRKYKQGHYRKGRGRKTRPEERRK